MIAGGGASSLIALVLGKLTDMAFYQQDSVVVYLAPIALLGISVLHGGSQYLSQFLLVRVAQGVMLEIRTLMFKRILHWGDDLFMKYRCAEVQAKFINEASTALTNAAGVLTIIIRDSIQIVCLLGVLFWHNWLKWYGFFGHIQSPHHAHNARNETASLRGAFAFHPEEGTGQRAGCFRWFDPRLGYLYPARFLRLGRQSLGHTPA